MSSEKSFSLFSSTRNVLLVTFVAVSAVLLRVMQTMMQSSYTANDRFDLSMMLPSLMIGRAFFSKTTPKGPRIPTVFEYPKLTNWTNGSYSYSPVKDLLKIYIYELSEEFGANVESYLYNYYVEERMESNHKLELAMIQLFRSYPGRTWDPEEADVFVVPYAHAGHCQQLGFSTNCFQVRLSNLLSELPYYNTGKQRNHLFMALQDVSHMRQPMRMKMHFKLISGPRTKKSKHGLVILPIFNDWTIYQPSVILARNESFWTRPRKYAFSYFYAEVTPFLQKNATISRRFRTFFNQDLQHYYGYSYSNDTTKDDKKNDLKLGGLPFLNEPMAYGNRDWPAVRRRASESYMDSVFCPVLAGDMAWQGRFFDAVLNGCLPIVLSWQLPKKKGAGVVDEKSWFIPFQPNQFPLASKVQETYPFHTRLFGDPDTGIDYDSFVVECPGNEANESDVSILRRTMEDLLLNRPEEIRQRQLYMKEAALAFTFGLGGDAHRYNDGFARTIRVLHNHVKRCLGPSKRKGGDC